MADRRDGETLRWLEALCRGGALAGLDDGPLLDRFVGGPGRAGEAAFEALVRRHGPTVLAVCRRHLADPRDADDAFQATFLILARRAATVRNRARLGPWLSRVATRVALRARAEASRREGTGRAVALAGVSPEAPSASVGPDDAEAASLVRAEVDRLPAADRELIRLTYWQGKTYTEAAALLSCPIGTVRSRLARTRGLLRGRLARLGLAPALALAATAIPRAGASESLISRTVRAASRGAGRIPPGAEVGAVPASVSALVEGELAMWTSLPWKPAAALLLLSGALAAGIASEAGAPPARPEPPPSPPKRGTPSTAAASPELESRPGTKASPLAASILANGDIEGRSHGQVANWRPRGKIPGVSHIVSREPAHSGEASLCLAKSAPRYFPIAEWTQEIKWEGAHPRLKVSAWVRAEQAAKAVLDVQFLDGEGMRTHAWAACIGDLKAGDLPVTHDWKRYWGVVAIPPGTERLVIAPQIYGPGVVWFDDIEAVPTDEPATDPTAP